MDERKLLTGNRFLNFALSIIIVFLIVWVLYIGRAIILPFLVALFLAFILDPIVRLFTRFKIPVPLAVLITLILAFVILYLLGLLVYANVQMFVEQFPKYQERMLQSIDNFMESFNHILSQQKYQIYLDRKTWSQIDWIAAVKNLDIAKGLLNSVGSFLTFLFKTIIVIIFLAYLLMGKRNIDKKIRLAFDHAQAERILSILNSVTTQVQKYLGAKTLVSFMTGGISILIFVIFGLDFAIFWGFLIFLFNFIPNIGSIIASILPVIFSLVQFGSVSKAFWMLVALAFLQTLMGNVIEPRLMGRSLNLSPLMVIISLIFWGYLWGVAGMILAVPILATLTIVFENVPELRFLSVFFRGKVG
ncbi:MAG: AI-2E family transporter [Calditrichaeota bacterium]|nr:AI-2E family transporter [Calditrichota bacterium]